MKKQLRYRIAALAALIAFPLSWAAGAVSLQFNNVAGNTVSGSPGTILASPNGQITLTLQLVGTVPTNALDYWLTQFSGPMAGVFSIITPRDFTSSLYPDATFTDAQVTSSGDARSNSTAGGAADGVPDNVINPRNGFDLGSTKLDTTTDNPAGTNQVVTLTLKVAANALSGLYQIRTFDYAGFGWSSTTLADQTFTSQAAINVSIVPEPATWSFVVLGVVALAGMSAMRFRRQA